jgi:hypothetical protein
LARSNRARAAVAPRFAFGVDEASAAERSLTVDEPTARRLVIMAVIEPEPVWVQVVDVEVGEDREITFGKHLAEGLGDRQDDIQSAIQAGAQTVAKSLETLPQAEGWRLGEVSASFGITLTAEAGVIVSKASAGASFEISVKFTRSGS